MSDNFDPYHKWLGIPPKDQPPNHYRLLAIELFEADPDVIGNAADQRMGHVRSFQMGKDSDLSQRILNEIATAKVCLLNSRKKADYDWDLRQRMCSVPPPPPPPTVDQNRHMFLPPVETFVPQTEPEFDFLAPGGFRKKKLRKTLSPFLIAWVVFWVGVMLLAGIVALSMSNRWEPQRKPAIFKHIETPNPGRASKSKSRPEAQRAEPESPRLAGQEESTVEKPETASESSIVGREPAMEPYQPPIEKPVVKPEDSPAGDASLPVNPWAAAKANTERQPSSRRINKLVLWNEHNVGYNDRGTDVCNVALLQGRKELWRLNGLRIPWAANKDTFLAVPVPRISADAVRVEIVRWQANGGGLSEVQVFSGRENIAQGCRVTASANYSGEYPEIALTDGITTSAASTKGYWLLPDRTQGWAEIHLRDSERRQERPSVLDADDNTPAANALSEGLEWLIRQQQSDGHWTFTTGPNSGSLADSPCCATAMGLIPLLRAGYTHRAGDYREVIDKGLKFMTRSMIGNKNIGKLFEPGSRMYGHAICTIALCEAAHTTRERRLREAAQAAVNFIVYAQDPKGGGWRYEPQQGGDTSVTGWQLTALSMAKETAKLQVPQVTFAKAGGFLNTVQMGGGASYGYEPGNAGSGPANTPVGLLCRIHLGCKKDHPALRRGMDQVSDQGPSPDNMYFNYYGTQLMRYAQGDRWLKWRSKIRDQLVTAQSIQGDSKGSWYFPGSDLGAGRGGRLYFTSMAVMILQFCEQD